MKKLLITCFVGFVFIINIIDVNAETSSSVCLNNTVDESQCKNCCDCLIDNSITRRSCRDEYAAHDFSCNSAFLYSKEIPIPKIMNTDFLFQ